MSRQRNIGRSWSGIRAVLSDSLKQIDIDPKDSLDWVSFCWGFTVGKEIASVSRVTKVSPKSLYVDVAGEEWLPALKGLKEGIIEEMRKQAGCEKLSRIVFKAAPVARENSFQGKLDVKAESDS